MFSTPYTPSGKAHGEVDEQFMLKTILTSSESFPYVKRRSRVIKADKVRGTSLSCYTYQLTCNIFQIHLTPLEVAIIGMQDKIQSLRRTLEQDPPDGKLLQMQLQGGIATAVNQVWGVL